MKQETKIIILGAMITLAVLFLAIFLMYFINVSQKNVVYNETNSNSSSNNNSNNLPIQDIAQNVVTVYLFKSDYCGHCKKAQEFFTSILNDYDYLRVVTYEVTNTPANNSLMQKVGIKFGLEKVTAVPLIVIGNDFYLNGYSEARDESLKEAIEKAYKDVDYEDIVEITRTENLDLEVKANELKSN